MIDPHYYALYSGEIGFLGGTNLGNGIKACIFKGQNMYWYEKEHANHLNGQLIDVYFSKCAYGRLIIPKNPIITAQRHVEPLNPSEGSGHSLIGKYGCIPKFIKGISNGIAYIQMVGYKVITLHIARHDMIHPVTQMVLELEPHFFPISDAEYDKLNVWYKTDNNIQGGFADHTMQELIVRFNNGKNDEIIKRF